MIYTSFYGIGELPKNGQADCEAEPPTDSEFLGYFVLYSRLSKSFGKMGQIKSNSRLKMKFFALGRLKNQNVPHLHPNSTMFMPLERLQLKIYAFSGKFNVCFKRVLML